MKILSDRSGSSNFWFIVRFLVPNREGIFIEQFCFCFLNGQDLSLPKLKIEKCKNFVCRVSPILWRRSSFVRFCHLVSSLSPVYLPKGCKMSSSASLLVLGSFVEVEIVVGGVVDVVVSLRCSWLMASISPVSIALYSSSVNVKNSATDLSCTYASVRYSFWMVVICAGGVWLIILFSGTDSIGLQLEVILTRQ